MAVHVSAPCGASKAVYRRAFAVLPPIARDRAAVVSCDRWEHNHTGAVTPVTDEAEDIR